MELTLRFPETAKSVLATVTPEIMNMANAVS